MKKIEVRNPVVDLDGDEMARVIWTLVKEKLIFPYLNLELKYFDLSIDSRNRTEDSVTVASAEAIRKYNVGIKCATMGVDVLTFNKLKLKKMWKSPNGTIRNALGGTVVREPIMVKNVPRIVQNWTQPIIIARHGYADQYSATNFRTKGKGRLTISFHPENGPPETHEVFNFKGDGIALAMFNTDESIFQFARTCFKLAIERKMPLFLSTKDSILKNYDSRFKDIFDEVHANFAIDFQKLGITYEHRVIDDMVACALKWSGNFIWACKNYDGDVQSDSVAQGFGSLGLMTSVLIASDERTLVSEAAHGSISRHYALHLKNEPTSTNSIASIFAWTRGLAHRAKLDENPELIRFCRILEDVCIATVETGQMTKDLANCIHGEKLSRQHYLETEPFLDAVRFNFDRRLALEA